MAIPTKAKPTQALLLVDIQNDFFPGGTLGVNGADALFPLANDVQPLFANIIATKDWHPANHKSFATNHSHHQIHDIILLNGIQQILWPDHCIQNSTGSEFHPTLKTDRIQKIIYKGIDPEIDSYSAFFDNAHQRNTGLDAYLKEQGITDLYIMGLATDYCIRYSVLDALSLGYNTFVITDGCFGIDQQPGDIEEALNTMEAQGAKLILSSEI
jgi:nicotinamidase/pyrazinamidase